MSLYMHVSYIDVDRAHVCPRLMCGHRPSSSMPTYAHVCSRMLTYAHVCSRMLTYAHVCWRILTYACAYGRFFNGVITDIFCRVAENIGPYTAYSPYCLSPYTAYSPYCLSPYTAYSIHSVLPLSLYTPYCLSACTCCASLDPLVLPICLHSLLFLCLFKSLCQHTSTHVSICQHTSAYVSIREHTWAYVSIREHSWDCLCAYCLCASWRACVSCVLD
jgi:hypothetical protein